MAHSYPLTSILISNVSVIVRTQAHERTPIKVHCTLLRRFTGAGGGKYSIFYIISCLTINYAMYNLSSAYPHLITVPDAVSSFTSGVRRLHFQVFSTIQV